jgi:hypothetical protein
MSGPSTGGNALSLIKAVMALVAERRTGVLDVRAQGVRTRIYFANGKAVFADDEALGETFGRLLVRRGVLTNEQFVRVIDEMTLAAKGDTQLRFGEVAVGLGVLTPEQVERGLSDQVSAIISRSLQRDESQWTFDDSLVAAKPPRSFVIDLDPILSEAARPASEPVRQEPKLEPKTTETTAGAPGPEASAHASRMAAEQSFQKGLALLHANQPVTAAIELRRAARLQPESLEYLLYATWAEARIHRDVPSEPDRRALQDIAEKAKKRDPLFAFASYVLGQLAMWSGDDEAAKRCFYEALRLDPTSEAGHQVRILARRGAGAPAPAAPSHHERTGPSVPPPIPADARATARLPTAETPEALPPSPPSSSRWTMRLVFSAAFVAAGAYVIFGVARSSVPIEASAPASSPVPPVSVDAALPVDAERQDTAGAGEGPPAGQEDKEAKWGHVRLPPRAAGHRIFVDGRRFRTDEGAPIRLPCGPHVVQIGSSGTPESIELPCGGEVQLQ